MAGVVRLAFAFVAPVLVVNAGSTSLKLDVVDDDDGSRRIESLGEAGSEIEAVGHRVVHGGERFREPVLVDEGVKSELIDLLEIAPLHNGPAVTAIEDAQAALPGVPHVAVFDTAFHASMPEEAVTYAVPREWRERWAVRRFGFHGLSVQWAAEQVQAARLVVCHLGGGCSVTAVLDGRSVDTTMGMTPLEGVPMATRSGSVDPGALLYLLRENKLTVERLDHALEHESGLEALGGLDAPLGLAVYSHRIAGAVAAMAASLGGLDAIVFTAGVGENVPPVREEVCRRLAFLGVELDKAANDAARPDEDVAAPGSAVRVIVLHAREEIVIARAVRRLVQGA
jgi:acetate kinase